MSVLGERSYHKVSCVSGLDYHHIAMPAARFSLSVTVAAIISDGATPPRYLLVEEHTPEGLKLNNPAGHLDEGESPQHGVVREALEETARIFTPQAVVEDSRCPINARCVWAGRLVLSTRIKGAGWRETVKLTLGQPYATHGAGLALVSAEPGKMAGWIAPPDRGINANAPEYEYVKL